jgi:hypothetical protein
MIRFDIWRLIVGVGGLGREIAIASAVQLAWLNGGKWCEKSILAVVDATHETGRAADGFQAYLPTPPPNRYFALYLPDTNIAGIAAETECINPEIATAFQVVPRDALALAPHSTAAIGGFQKPACGTAAALLNEQYINDFLKTVVAELKKAAGAGPAFIDVVGGANGSIGASCAAAISRCVRTAVGGEARWRVTFHLAALTPDGRTPDRRAAEAIFYTGLKDLAVTAKRG